MVETGVEVTGATQYLTAIIPVRADLAALLGARHHLGLVADMLA